MGAAVAASLLVHGLLLSVLAIDFPWPGVEFHPGNAPITVRIAPAPVFLPDVPLSPEPEERRRPLTATPTKRSVEVSPGARALPGAARPGAETPAVAPGLDPHYYLAQDLDSYPRPLAPLRIGRPARASAGEVRLELLIDEHGVVRDVIFAGPAQPDGAEVELRATLAATSFMPARKDGRPVRSRILLSLNPGAEEREP